MKLELEKIRLDGDTQPRVSLNEEVVREYAEYMMEGAVFPAVTVFHDGSNYWLADGFHRYFANKRVPNFEIEAEVVNGTLSDAQLYSAGSNDKHGLRRTSADKRRAVMKLLKHPEWSEWSDREIARITQVTAMTVGRIKKSLKLEPKTERKFSKNGEVKTMKVANIGPSSKPEEKEDNLAEMASELEAVMAENKILKENMALEFFELPEDEKLDIHVELEKYRQSNKLLEVEVKAITRSRDSLQVENTELKKQVIYWKKRCQKFEITSN